MRGRFLTLLMCPHAPQTLIISCPCRVRNICIQKLEILTAQIPFHFLPEVVAPLFHLPMYSASEWTRHCGADESGTVDFFSPGGKWQNNIQLIGSSFAGGGVGGLY